MKNKWITYIVGIIMITVFLTPVIAQDTEESKPNLGERNKRDFYDTRGSLGDGGNRDWSIVAVYPIPESASGLAYDGTYLYCGIYGSDGDKVYQIDPATGNYALLCNGPQEDSFGLTFDGTYLWTTDHPSNPAVALQFDMSGNLVSQFNLPDQYMSGIAYDNGDFWVATYYPDPATIYKVNGTGSIITNFTAPDDQPWDLTLENDNLWMADYWGDTLYKIDPSTGELLESHESEYNDPAGIVWDGQYLWYCDNGQGGNDYLYKIDLSGSGTPEIHVPITSHNYGVVTIGQSSTWQVTVQNTGTVDLQINNITYSGPGSTYLSCSLTFPLIITLGNQTQIPLTYAPLTYGELNALGTIASNDPIHPTVDLALTGNAVHPGPDINLPNPSHNYGPVRINAYTRWFLEIQNTGNESLTITDITSSDNTHFIVDDQITYPFIIGVLQSAQVGIWFQPRTSLSYTGILTIYSDDPDENPILATVQGTGLHDDYSLGDLLWHYTLTADPYDNSPKAMAPINDINGDNRSDVIICSEDDYIRCFNGNAHMTGDVLWEHEIYAGSVYSQNGLVITQDLNSDGYDDVVVGSAWGGRLIRAISGRTGETIWTHDTHEYGSGGWVYQVDSRFDYNNDGIKDILAATGDDGTDTGPKRVYCLDGLTGSSIWECFLGGPVFSVIGVEDYTGDGQPDVVAGASNELETIGYVYGIDGTDGGIEWTYISTGSSVWALEQIDDITNDGISDVIIGDFYGNIYGLNSTNGNVIYSNAVGSSALIIERFEKINDVNGDGHPDIVPAHLGSGSVGVKVIDGQTGQFIWEHPVYDKPAVVDRIEDISGDGINDILVGTCYTNNYCYWLDGTDGNELHFINLGNPVDAITSIPDVVGDVNNTWEMVAGGRDGSITCLSGGGEISDPIQTLNLTLYKDWNLITVPVDNGWTAETLGKNISGCTVVVMFDGATQNFTSHVVGTPHDDFPILDGVGYFVYVTSDSFLNVTGLPILGVTVPIYTLWNTIGWYHYGSTLAGSLGVAIDNCTVVTMFDGATQNFATHVMGTPHDNFPITQGMGLFIYATSDSWWTGEG